MQIHRGRAAIVWQQHAKGFPPQVHVRRQNPPVMSGEGHQEFHDRLAVWRGRLPAFACPSAAGCLALRSAHSSILSAIGLRPASYRAQKKALEGLLLCFATGRDCAEGQVERYSRIC